MAMTQAQIEYKRRQRAERMVNGICTRCGKEPLVTKVLCQQCKEYVGQFKKAKKKRVAARDRMRRLRAARGRSGNSKPATGPS